MCSEVICRENLQLLFTIMEKDPDAVIRSNVISLTADLLIRFPNAVAPWTPNIYARLQDTCDDVRLNCVITVAQLVLKEQIKVGKRTALQKLLRNILFKVAWGILVCFFCLTMKTSSKTGPLIFGNV